MSKFQSTVSTVAALASIFGAGAAGWKLAADSQRVPEPVVEEKKAEPEIKDVEPPVALVTPPVTPPPVPLPQPAAVVTHPPVTPPVAPPPPVDTAETTP